MQLKPIIAVAILTLVWLPRAVLHAAPCRFLQPPAAFSPQVTVSSHPCVILRT
jgi:hypothetical protein